VTFSSKQTRKRESGCEEAQNERGSGPKGREEGGGVDAGGGGD